ncbi:MAG: glutamine--fructose-6-phosphate aminotransferase, partial [Cutibacterium granulosum]|nr:glutamine--fructose-6-phosphate aminotransferase [Cutibacterium granulosum]
MCGIVGYVGSRPAKDVIIDGLRRLEYRGYDSAGLAVVADGALHWAKKSGKLTNLEAELSTSPLPESGQGIGHTRWATHGAPTDTNAHPHISADGKVAVVHNGIIENFAALRAELQVEGVSFASDTDTEVAAHLIARETATGAGLSQAVGAVAARLEGAFTLVAV